MATIYRALVTTVLLVYGYAVVTGVAAGEAAEARAWHVSVGFVAAVFAVLVQSLPFAYFLGTGFWVKAFVRASRAEADWEARHALWMKQRGYVFMYLAAFAPAAAAITGMLADTGRLVVFWHAAAVWVSMALQLSVLFLIPPMLKRNAALMDELAATHQVPRPGTPAMEELIQHEEEVALPPLFQLSRLLLFAAFQILIIWLYLRFGTEGFRAVPFLPYGLGASICLTLGLGLNSRYDPDAPRSGSAAWARALTLGAAATAVVVWLGNS